MHGSWKSIRRRRRLLIICRSTVAVNPDVVTQLLHSAKSRCSRNPISDLGRTQTAGFFHFAGHFFAPQGKKHPQKKAWGLQSWEREGAALAIYYFAGCRAAKPHGNQQRKESWGGKASPNPT